MPYREQLRRKREFLQHLLQAALPNQSVLVEPAMGTPVSEDGQPWHFRHKAAFVFGTARDGFVLGHYAAGTQTVIPVEECPVHSERANRIAFALREALARADVRAYGRRRGILRHVIVRTTHDEREAVVMLVVSRNDPALRVPLRALLAGPDRPDGLLVNVHDQPGPYMVGEQTIRIHGRHQVRENRLGLDFLVSPTAFFQTNPDAAAVLLEQVVNAAESVRDAAHRDSRLPHAGGRAGPPLNGRGSRASRGSLLDLYAGSGLFALPLAARGWNVTAVEENRQAVTDARSNQRLNRLDAARVRFIAARVEDALPRLARDRFDVVVLDPPRQGCAPGVIRRLFRDVRPPRAVYVSCNPDALAGELPAIVASGYVPTRVQPIDMFPHTPHVEAIAVLDRLPTGTAGRAGRRPAATNS